MEKYEKLELEVVEYDLADVMGDDVGGSDMGDEIVLP